MGQKSSLGAAALTLGFGTALAQWVIGFVLRLPPAAAPAWLVFTLLVTVLLGGGALAARVPGGGVRAGAVTGLVAALVNLLVLGSLISGDAPGALVPSAVIWVPGSLLLGAAVGAIGAGTLGRHFRPFPRPPDWTAVFARLAASATLALVMLGGLVTSQEAGLAVVDWPNSFGYNMFLYPISRMVGGIYYEHTHRLFGSFVGLITLTLFVRLLFAEPRKWVQAAGGAALLLVIGQGILGGLRVTGHFTTATSPDLTRPSLALAMVHGITGQLFFAWMVCLAAFTSRTWRERTGFKEFASAGADRGVTAVLVVALIFQLLLGVQARHTGEGVMLHITFAIVVLVLVVIASVRLMGSHEDVAALRKGCGALLGHAMTQLVLGGLAFYLVNRRGGEGPPPGSEVLITTLHQTVGALLLANAVLLAVWTRRLLGSGASVAASSHPQTGPARP